MYLSTPKKYEDQQVGFTLLQLTLGSRADKVITSVPNRYNMHISYYRIQLTHSCHGLIYMLHDRDAHGIIIHNKFFHISSISHGIKE